MLQKKIYFYVKDNPETPKFSNILKDGSDIHNFPKFIVRFYF